MEKYDGSTKLLVFGEKAVRYIEQRKGQKYNVERSEESKRTLSATLHVKSLTTTCTPGGNITESEEKTEGRSELESDNAGS